MPATLYQSTDSGAPSLSNTAGSLITVLDAILVNGYGSKSPAGWSRPFTGTNKAVYRNNAASEARSYLRLDDANTGYGAFAAYDAMTDVDTGTYRFPTTGTANAFKPASSSYWMALADEKTLFFASASSLGSTMFGLYAGEMVKPVTETDVGNFVLIGSTSTSTGSSTTIPVLCVGWNEIPPFQTVFVRKSDIGTVLIAPRSCGPLGIPGILHTRFSTAGRGGFLRTTQPHGQLTGSYLHYFYNAGTDNYDNVYGGRLRWLVILGNTPSDYATPGMTLSGTGVWSGKSFLTLGAFSQYNAASFAQTYAILWDQNDS